MYLHPPVLRWRKCKRETSRDQRSGISVIYLLPSSWTIYPICFTISMLLLPKNISGTEYTKKILWLCQQNNHWLKFQKKYGKDIKLGILLRFDIFLTVEEKKEWLKQKCKVEEDHRIFAERPFSYGYLFWYIYIYIIKHIGIKVLLVMNWKVCKFILVARSHVWMSGKLRLRRRRLQYFYLRPTLTFILTCCTAQMQLLRAKLQGAVQFLSAL